MSAIPNLRNPLIELMAAAFAGSARFHPERAGDAGDRVAESHAARALVRSVRIGKSVRAQAIHSAHGAADCTAAVPAVRAGRRTLDPFDPGVAHEGRIP